MSTTPCPTYTAPAKMPVCTMGEQSSSSTIALNANATAETSRNALRTASEICIYTNDEIVLEEVSSAGEQA